MTQAIYSDNWSVGDGYSRTCAWSFHTDCKRCFDKQNNLQKDQTTLQSLDHSASIHSMALDKYSFFVPIDIH